VFEVIGSKESVDAARQEIESYIETRVGVGGSIAGVSTGGSRSQCNMKTGEFSSNAEDNMNNFNYVMFNSPSGYDREMSHQSLQSSTSAEAALLQENLLHSQPASATSSVYSSYPNKLSASRAAGSGHLTNVGGVNMAFLDQEMWASSLNDTHPPRFPNSFLETDWPCESLSTGGDGTFGSSNNWEEFISNSMCTHQDMFISNLPSLLEFSLQLGGGTSGGNGWISEDRKNLFNQCSADVFSVIDQSGDQRHVITTRPGGEVERGWVNTDADLGLWNDRQTKPQFGNTALATSMTAFITPSHRKGGVEHLARLSGFKERSLSYSPSSSPTESSVSTGSVG